MRNDQVGFDGVEEVIYVKLLERILERIDANIVILSPTAILVVTTVFALLTVFVFALLVTPIVFALLIAFDAVHIASTDAVPFFKSTQHHQIANVDGPKGLEGVGDGERGHRHD
jgi:hypothetical protein